MIVSIRFSSICHIERTLSGATTPSHSGPGNNGHEGAPYSPKLQQYLNLTIRLFCAIYRTLVGRDFWSLTSVFWTPSRLSQTRLHYERWKAYRLTSKGRKRRQKEYKSRYDRVRKVIHWKLCKWLKFDDSIKRFE